MEESQTSESVAVLPDMSEPLTSETEEAAALTSEHEAHPVAVTASVTSVSGVPGVPGVGVPVSLPVGSIIGVANSTNGTTFNVITQEQLQVRPEPNETSRFAARSCVCTYVREYCASNLASDSNNGTVRRIFFPRSRGLDHPRSLREWCVGVRLSNARICAVFG